MRIEQQAALWPDSMLHSGRIPLYPHGSWHISFRVSVVNAENLFTSVDEQLVKPPTRNLSHMFAAQSRQDAEKLQYFRQLRSGRWFGNLPPTIAQALFNAGSRVEYPAGRPIYVEDSPDQGIFGIIEGTVHFETTDCAGRRILLGIAGQGAWFGEMSAPAETRTLVTAHAFRRVRAWRVPAFALRRLFREMPDLCKAYAQLMTSRITGLTERICIAQRPSAFAQVAGALAYLHRGLKENAPLPHSSLIYMTQNDLADMTGLCRQTINVIMRQLENSGSIRVQRRMIEICDSEALDLCSNSKTERLSELI